MKVARIKELLSYFAFALLVTIIFCASCTKTVDAPSSASYDDRVKQRAANILDDMTLREKVCQMFIVSQDQLVGMYTVTSTDETARSALEKFHVGGIVYFSENIVNREQCMAMIAGVQSYSDLGLFIAVDEEGGRVARLGNNSQTGVTAFPDMQIIGASGNAENAFDVGRTIGKELAELGFNLDFAPVADIFSNPQNMVIGARSFGSDPNLVAEMVSSCVSGFVDSGMLCTLKHFPGHGDTTADSHYGAAEISKTIEQLENCELIPFKAGIEAGAQLVMIGHLTLPNAVSENVPATLSYEIVTGLLRNEIGFRGIIISDAMQMKAITDSFSSQEAAVRAVKAGVDIILMPENLEDAVDGVIYAVENGDISEKRINDSVLRILETKISYGIIK